MKNALICVAALCLLSSLQAQQPVAYCKKGEELFEEREYLKAYPLLTECAQAKPQDVHLRQKLNQCLYLAGRPEEAVKGFRQMQADFKKLPVSYWLYLGRSLQALKQFEEAAQTYKDFLRYAEPSHPQRAAVKDDLIRCATGIHLQGQPKRAVVQNMGPTINSTGDELRPIPHPKNEKLLFFSSAREGTLGGRRNAQGEPDFANGQYLGDIFTAELLPSGWAPPQALSTLINSTRYDIPMGFSAENNTFYFFQGYSTYSGEIFADTAFRQMSKLGTLFAARFESPMQTAKGDTDPFWFTDSVLLFASRRAGGYGGLDLYITHWRDGQWTPPQNLGPDINTPYDERAPFLAKDGRTLYFSSNHPERSFGQLDILRSVFNDLLGRWSKPYNLGLKFNSAFDDTYFFLSPKGDKAWFASNRPGGQGGYDLYLALFSEQHLEQQHQSQPLLFTHVLKQKKQKKDELSDFYIEPLYLEEQGPVLSQENIKKLQRLVQLLHAYPQLDVQLTAHSDPLDYDNYPLFFSLKQVEEVGNFLLSTGISPNRIRLRTVGDNYPVAKSLSKNATVRRFNRRIDIVLTGLEDVPVKIVIKTPPVSPEWRDSRGQAYYTLLTGLNYRIQLAKAKELFPADVQLKDPHATIEKDLSENIYYFTAGLLRSYRAAQTMLQQMKEEGFPKAHIVPYLNGARLSREEALAYLDLYPELEEWLANDQ